MNSLHGHRHDSISAYRTELALGSSYDWRVELSPREVSEDLRLEELLLKKFMSAYNFLKFLGHQMTSTKLNKIDSNYSYGGLEAITSIQTT
jgi:hypothetical protein